MFVASFKPSVNTLRDSSVEHEINKRRERECLVVAEGVKIKDLEMIN